jgi:multiple sugar transport system permease protein
VGLDQYITAFTEDTLFWKSLWNTLYYVGMSLPLGIVGSLFCALLLNQKIKGKEIARTLFFLPAITPIVAAVLIWTWIFDPNFGLFNYGLSYLGIEGPKWLGSVRWAKPALIIITWWTVVGGPQMIIFLASLQGIPVELYEVAEIDGAGTHYKFFHITLPMLTPTIFFNLILGVISGFKVFALVYVGTQGGPAYSTLMYVLYLYFNAFNWFRMGYGSALAWILFVILLVFTYLQFKFSKKWVYYAAE